MTRNALAAVCVLIAPVLSGCGAQPTIVGVWHGIGANGIDQTLTFDDDGSAKWLLESPQFSGSFDLLYQIDYTRRPHPFDLGPFDRGPLDGRTLFGIVEFNGNDEFRLDVEPGPAGAEIGSPEGDDERPPDFTDQSVTYERVDRQP